MDIMIEKAQPIALLLARVALGIIFIAHGWEKFAMSGIDSTTEFFESVGVPLARATAVGTATLELVGGVALVLGLLLPVVGTLLTLDMVGAIVFVHGSKGLFIDKDGYELVLGLAAASLAIAFSGGGALAADSLWQGHRADFVHGRR
ncbi:putative oxidoreductase [Nonomuraea maritima]|uniref:Putative oxidoreductase n=1 Tax=Nonomuraea maritima TaxID=683260 RepID=A0A1G9EBN4_9ACTN|nr:DoxX family protein [Nonomuraea maritima]SDK73579.1 putative oxidoreductase [Nonomuraea maritima]